VGGAKKRKDGRGGRGQDGRWKETGRKRGRGPRGHTSEKGERKGRGGGAGAGKGRAGNGEHKAREGICIYIYIICDVPGGGTKKPREGGKMLTAGGGKSQMGLAGR